MQNVYRWLICYVDIHDIPIVSSMNGVNLERIMYEDILCEVHKVPLVWCKNMA